MRLIRERAGEQHGHDVAPPRHERAEELLLINGAVVVGVEQREQPGRGLPRARRQRKPVRAQKGALRPSNHAKNCKCFMKTCKFPWKYLAHFP